jgi:hypothetical protein
VFASLLIFVLALSPAVGQEKQDKQAQGIALIRHGVELTDIRESGPFQYHDTLTLTDEALGKQFTGEEVVMFASPKQWRRELRIKGYYDESAIFVGSEMYRGRSLNFTPPAARKDIAGSLRNLPEMLHYKVLRVFDQKAGNADSTCVYVQKPTDQKFEYTWCFDQKSGLPTALYYTGSGHFIEFENYKAFGKKFMPGMIEIFVGGKSKDKAVIDTVEANVPNDPKTFQPPSNYPPRPWCDDSQPPIISSSTKIDIPPGARAHSGWELLYELTVDAKGNVVNVVPLSPRPFADRVAMTAFAEWKFKPAMCGTTPVPTDFIAAAFR